MRNNPEDGWRCVANHDASMRRGAWYRVRNGAVEVAAGREGDDHSLVISLATAEGRGLLDILENLAWVYEDLRPENGPACGCTDCSFEDYETLGDCVLGRAYVLCFP